MEVVFVCDFSVTTYHAKTQQVLSDALPWLMHGIRRCEQANESSDEPLPLPERSLKRLRRMTFAANRCHWFSAAEFSFFVLTCDAGI